MCLAQLHLSALACTCYSMIGRFTNIAKNIQISSICNIQYLPVCSSAHLLQCHLLVSSFQTFLGHIVWHNDLWCHWLSRWSWWKTCAVTSLDRGESTGRREFPFRQLCDSVCGFIIFISLFPVTSTYTDFLRWHIAALSQLYQVCSISQSLAILIRIYFWSRWGLSCLTEA